MEGGGVSGPDTRENDFYEREERRKVTHPPRDEGPAVLTLSKKEKKRLLDPAGTESKDRESELELDLAGLQMEYRILFVFLQLYCSSLTTLCGTFSLLYSTFVDHKSFIYARFFFQCIWSHDARSRESIASPPPSPPLESSQGNLSFACWRMLFLPPVLRRRP